MVTRWHPLHTAAIAGNIDLFIQEYKKRIVEDSNCLLQTDTNGWAAIHFAATSGNAELIFALHKLGADVNLYTQHKVALTPLIISCSKNYPETVKALLECGANPSLGRKTDGRTPLHFCAEFNFPDPARILIDSHPSLIDVMDKDGKTSITIALQAKSKKFIELISSTFPRYESLIRRIDISTVPKPLIREPSQSQPGQSQTNSLLDKAFNAARTGDCEYLRSLLSKPPNEQLNVNSQMRNGWTLLMEASAVGKFDVVNLLISFGVNTEARNKKGQTALHEAVKNGYLRAVRALLDGGACMDAVTKKGQTIEEIAENHGHMTLLAYLINRRSNLIRSQPTTFCNTTSGSQASESAHSLPSHFTSSVSSSSSTTTIPLTLPEPIERLPTSSPSLFGQRDRFNLLSWLNEIGLAQYGNVLEANGFDSIASLELLKESDLTVMGFLLGHRRVFMGEYAKLHHSHPFLFERRELILPINTESEYKQNIHGGSPIEKDIHKKKKKKRHKKTKPMTLESPVAGNVKPPRHDSGSKKQLEDNDACNSRTLDDGPLSRIPSDHSMHYVHADTLINRASDSPLSKDFTDDLFLDSFDESVSASNTMQHPNSVKELRYEELEIGPIIGEGSFGTVRSGWWRGMHVAIKALRLVDNVCNPCGEKDTACNEEQETVISQRIRELRHEALTMSRVCNHSYVINFIGIITAPIPCVVTSFCSNGSMEDLLFKSSYKCQINNDTLLRFAMETAQGIQHLHLEGIIHRDLAARNLLIDENFHVRVADFGFARIKEESASKGYTKSDMGPVRWSAPEAMRNKKYSENSDIFSYGVVLYEMFTQRMPWDGYDTLDVAIRVCSGERMTIPESVPHDISDLIILCWSHEPICRPSMSEIIKCLTLMRNQVALLDKNSQELLWMLQDEEDTGDSISDTSLIRGISGDKEWLQKWYFNESSPLDYHHNVDEENQRILNHYHIMTPNISRDNSENNPKGNEE